MACAVQRGMHAGCLPLLDCEELCEGAFVRCASTFSRNQLAQSWSPTIGRTPPVPTARALASRARFIAKSFCLASNAASRSLSCKRFCITSAITASPAAFISGENIEGVVALTEHCSPSSMSRLSRSFMSSYKTSKQRSAMSRVVSRVVSSVRVIRGWSPGCWAVSSGEGAACTGQGAGL